MERTEEIAELEHQLAESERHVEARVAAVLDWTPSVATRTPNIVQQKRRVTATTPNVR
jgi:hypothetical protein